MQAKVLLLSQRRIADLVAYCIAYELEDTFAAVVECQRIDATDLPAIELSRRAYKLARLACRSPGLARLLAPSPRSQVLLQSDFDLFFPVFSHAFQLYSLATIRNWRQRCRKAACYITEVWSEFLPEYLFELLSDFDHIFLSSCHCVQDVARVTGRPCTYLPLAVDVPRFSPVRPDRPRPIDVCNIGRRSPVTHRALLEMAERKPVFYYYDTVAASGDNLKNRTFRVDSPHEHRRMLATILKHSAYYFANRSYIDRSDMTAGHEEISSRFYEGAAAGTVMIGEAPRAEEFLRQFDWPDAVIHVPFDSPDIGRILTDLNADPDRLQAVRCNGVREAALRHDWLHRIQVVFDLLGLTRTEGMRSRAQLLSEIALRVDHEGSSAAGQLPGLVPVS